MSIAFAALVAIAIVLPHRLTLSRVTPALALAIWLSALTMRALASLLVVVGVMFFLPGTELFGLLTHWCWHTVVPVLTTHLGLNGHSIGDVATLAPLAALLASTASLAWAVFCGARSVRRIVVKGTLGPGPDGSLIIAGDGVLVAAAGLARPRVVVSAGALTAFDDDELAASLEHERGHIARRHRYLLLYAEVCGAVGRFIPGRRGAVDALAFHLERDADEYAIARRHDRYALASAICKAATARAVASPLLALGGAGGVADRLELLTDAQPLRAGRAVRALTTTMVTLAIALGIAVPATAVAGIRQLSEAPPVHHCPR